MDIIIRMSASLHSILGTRLPAAWDFFRITSNTDLSIILNSVSYLVTYFSFIVWFYKIVVRRLEDSTGQTLTFKDKVFTAIISVVPAVRYLWPVFLLFNHFFTCTYYPWVTATGVVCFYIPLMIPKSEQGIVNTLLLAFLPRYFYEPLGLSVTRDSDTLVRLPGMDRDRSFEVGLDDSPTYPTQVQRDDTPPIKDPETSSSYQRHPFESSNSYQRNPFESSDSYQVPSFESSSSYQRNPFESSNSYQRNPFESSDSDQGLSFESSSSYQRPPFENAEPYELAHAKRDIHKRHRVPPDDTDKFSEYVKPKSKYASHKSQARKLSKKTPLRDSTKESRKVQGPVRGTSRHKKGYCGRCWKVNNLPFLSGFSGLRQPYTTRSGRPYGPPRYFYTIDQIIDEYGVPNSKRKGLV